ncbi:hypothetical protein [Peterkaempfera griseoplana]|uniref:hypothetical protein n=1 Tax=Peterkaempfera griseoplana TaxID=66896 RepID=UPI0006E1933C|nr:hypothetical protein [Peterkaempfera griseoplana]
MLTQNATGDPWLSLWLRVRRFAVPSSMIEAAATRRRTGDWAGACAAAGVDVDLDLRSVARTHGQELTARIRADLRQLVPDLLRWHMPRIAPDGLLRPGLTIALARYDTEGPDRDCPVQLVVRTPPAWADAGQRISLGLWDGSPTTTSASRHPRPRPHHRFRLDLHRHLWDARRTGELRIRSGADQLPAEGCPAVHPDAPDLLPQGHGCAVHRWAAEAEILLHAEGRSGGSVAVRLGPRARLVLNLVGERDSVRSPAWHLATTPGSRSARALPVLPDAATWLPPDLELLRAGLIEPDQLHPLVASALVPDFSPAAPSDLPDPERRGRQRLVECRGSQHRIGLVDGVLAPLDHDPDEIRREELLAALTGTPLPCLQAIDAAHRRPDRLLDIRERLVHGDTAGALAVVEDLLGHDARLPSGALRDELETAAQRRIAYGLYRAGLTAPGSGRNRPTPRLPRTHRSHPRHAASR